MSCLLFFTMCGEKPNIKLMAVKKLFVLKAFMCCCVLASLLVNKVLSSLLLRHHLNTANFSKYRVGSGSSGTSIVLFCHLIGLNDILRLNQILHVVLGLPTAVMGMNCALPKAAAMLQRFIHSFFILATSFCITICKVINFF